jgi:hypothetical protein
MARELARVRRIGPTYHVEEVILDIVKKGCGAAPAK